MSLQLAAQHLASKGRGPDTTLVHMAPSEVRGLQAIAKAHGGSLTVNPETGLPEAGFLSRLLPTIIGAGLAATGVGAPMAALLVGGGYGMATGSLKKGLMAGLGAYGGAGIGSSIMSAGQTAMAPAAVSPTVGAGAVPAAAVVPEAATAAVPAEYGAFAPTATNYGAFGEPIGAVVPPPAAAPTPTISDFGAGANAKDALLARGEVMSPAFVPGATTGSTFTAGLKAIADKPSLLLNKDNMYTLGAAILPAMMGGDAKGSGYKGSGPNPYEYAYDFRTGQYNRLPVGTRDTYTQMPGVPMQRAAGGTIEDMSRRNEEETFISNGGQTYRTGGLSDLGDYSDGGRLLKGPGDGVSDDIPATIANKRPARLADGEFVVPARVVSELGNGSTDAGARKLYAMMDRVQKARNKTVGKDRVAVDSRADKYLPA